MATREPQADPIVAQASPHGWAMWLRWLCRQGGARFAALGLALALGVGSGLLALLLFVKLGYEVLERETDALDLGVLAWLQQYRSPALDAAARALTSLGSEGIFVLAALLLVVFGWRGRWGAAAGMVLAAGGAQLLNDVLKEAFHRARPSPVTGWIAAQAYSFPSGHAMVSAAFYTFLGYLAWRVLHGWVRTAVIVGLVLLVLAIGLTRLYLAAHFFTDVIAGYLVGFIWADAVIIGGQVLARRRPVPATVAPGAEGDSSLAA